MSASSVSSDAPPQATRAVVIAASTGGPNALARLLPSLPARLGAAVLVAQHMPRGFTASLARRLDGLCALPVVEAWHGAPLETDHVYLGPGGAHLLVDHDGAALRLDDGDPVWGVRPAADLLFASAARAFGGAVVGVVLTGMGRDGAAGLRLVRAAGGQALVQEPSSSVVHGMPQAAIAHAGADHVAPLAELGPLVAAAVARLAPRPLPHPAAL